MDYAVSGVKQLGVYIMGGMMAISRAELLKELLPGLNELFGLEYTAQRTQAKIDLILIDELKKAEELQNAV